MSKAVEDLSLANDFIFGEVMRQPENVKPLLEAVLRKKIAEITYIERQQDIKDGFELHGIRLDISLEDSEKTQYAVEMQTGSAVDLERRIRYYQSSLDPPDAGGLRALPRLKGQLCNLHLHRRLLQAWSGAL